MRLNRFLLNTVTLVLIFFSTVINAQNSETDLKIVKAFKVNWPYEAFLAIPRISEIKPMLVVELDENMKFVEPARCIEVEYYEIEKKFKSKLLLERESLHRLLCKAMIRAASKTKQVLFLKQFSPGDEIGLRFDFYTGTISVSDIPYPPIDPKVLLGDLFVDGIEDIKFGDLEMPVEYDLEIKATPL
jgi:hypothetical protein